MQYCFNVLPNDEILDWSKSKAFADDKINVTLKFNFVLRTEENIVPFPTMFSKGLLHSHTRSLKVMIGW